jgi:hypothetical protein
MDSTSGRELFKFDRSLMERLSDNGMAMSRINVQRRMRPSISRFVRYAVRFSRYMDRRSYCTPRTILYPRLEDHDIVCHYPPVQGVEKDVFFFSHSNKENAEADSVSKHNTFEVCRYLDPIAAS